MQDLSLNIGWLYPDLMSTYGDRGNVTVLSNRLLWRKIGVNVVNLDLNSSAKDFWDIDLFVGGGAQDRQQEIVMRDLMGEKGEILKTKIEKGTPGIFTCGSLQLLGRDYEPAYGKKIIGLGIFKFSSAHPGVDKARCIGNIVIDAGKIFAGKINQYPYKKGVYLVGFENHGGLTYLTKKEKPLGFVKAGYGNNGEDKTEGAVYKNAFATYLHGPIFTTNPHFADLLLKLALEEKYQEKIELNQLDDSLEYKAHFVMVERSRVNF